MDRYLSPSTQRERKNEKPQQVSSHSLSAQHTNKSPLIVSIPHSIREQHITDTAFNDTRLFGDTPSQLIVSIPYPMRTQRNTWSKKLIVSIPYPPRETHAEHKQSKQSHSDINSPLARKRLRTRTKGKHCQPSSTLQGASPPVTPPAKRVHLDIPQQLAGSSRQYESGDTRIQQYESDNSLQSDSEHDDDTSQQHLIATSSQFSKQSSNFNKKYEKLITISSTWYDLGLALGLDRNTLDDIEDNNRENQTRLRETLSKRDHIKTLSWTEIIKALRNPIVGKNTLADELRRKYAPESMSVISLQPSSDPTSGALRHVQNQEKTNVTYVEKCAILNISI